MTNAMRFLVRYEMEDGDGEVYQLEETFPTLAQAMTFREQMLDAGCGADEVVSYDPEDR